ncbi:hypothetical protein [Neisseria bacilliformis]|uniref:hypothetical protein n=1 Tax=Neisseria bacilliformis TaxID=267212 RepID=UPI00080A940B|nr:hypothetical protein [Neisseria bacilliformis]
MKKYMFIEMPDRSVWRVPVHIIADNRNACYDSLGKDPLETRAETAELFEDPREIADWAENNMNWDKVRPHATLVKQGEIDYQAGWCEGEKTFADDTEWEK